LGRPDFLSGSLYLGFFPERISVIFIIVGGFLLGIASINRR
jgi:hypothetical protein